MSAALAASVEWPLCTGRTWCAVLRPTDPRVLGGATVAPVVTASDCPQGGSAQLRIAVWMSGADGQLAAEDLRLRARAVLDEAGCSTTPVGARGRHRMHEPKTPYA
ncbi:hypothetical protein J8I87_08815 [Paraburkholderia sp. LEh10]|uniref:hypothetical protein n=1 Tax=Paraburkholderia sp. LEh10 TaxID=2821353 RepID=UPI001AE206E8|nr:hypothetical protein [Paraburkholderia sp. LEh10]MBP0589815.1 hypothetical protein [Paraburkholderia sp. LEh10]